MPIELGSVGGRQVAFASSPDELSNAIRSNPYLVTGGVLGALLGIPGGPFAMGLGLTIGAFVGSQLS